jgi:hypothetical protein
MGRTLVLVMVAILAVAALGVVRSRYNGHTRAERS